MASDAKPCFVIILCPLYWATSVAVAARHGASQPQSPRHRWMSSTAPSTTSVSISSRRLPFPDRPVP